MPSIQIASLKLPATIAYIKIQHNGEIPSKTSPKITITFSLVLAMIAILANSTALAQTFEPPQIPNYNPPSDYSNTLTGPSSGVGGGAAGGEPTAAPTLMPSPQTDYTAIAMAIVIVAVIAAAIAAWSITQKRKTQAKLQLSNP